MAKPDSSTSENDFAIGQVVYILSNKNQSIIPAVIVEESIVKTLESKTVSWKLAIGSKSNPAKPQKIVDSTKIDGEIYSKLITVHTILQSRLTEFLNKTISDVQRREKAWYGTVAKMPAPVTASVEPAAAQTAPEPKKPQQTINKTETNQVKTPQPSVVVTNSKIDPESFLEDDILVEEVEPATEAPVIHHRQQPTYQAPKTEAEIKEQLRRMTLADDEPDTSENDPNTLAEGEKIQIIDSVVGPDGMTIPVNFKL